MRDAPTEDTTTVSYQAQRSAREGCFLALEGVGGSGKSTLAKLLAARLDCPRFHTAPDPLSSLQSFINQQAAALTHLAFYLSGALHVSDLARAALTRGPVIVDRYISSVIANHSATHRISNQDARQMIEPFLDYLARPDLTVYLHTDTAELMRRSRTRTERQGSGRPEMSLDRLRRLQAHFDEVAASDPTAGHVHTDARSPEQIAANVIALLPAHSPQAPHAQPATSHEYQTPSPADSNEAR
ncbi:thymidylate kinase [Streptacidiphilus sp. MAP12-16]|uniref:dTMP kinase n=1 Tax=Streptacidiphilus sp. MAP12-16 TaxID=3156300 RepID=UPI003517BAF7